MPNLTPCQIVAELDRYIIGQAAAKRAVAVAIRNRWRRRQLPPELAREVYPKNIIMIGPTGVGKTEIARRLAKLTGAPFVKVEASKYTEVGYHGRDVESMVRDLVDQALAMVRAEQSELVQEKAAQAAQEKLLDLLLPAPSGGADAVNESGTRQALRGKLRQEMAAGTLDDREVEITVSSRPAGSMLIANMGLDQMDPDMANMLQRLMPSESQRRRVSVRQARRILQEQETDKLLDKEKLTAEALTRAQEDGIIFLDEIDKIATPAGAGHGPDVSRQGVQRDLLPIVEGSTVNTRHGLVHTDHVLFIAAGAFHSTAVSDLMPELQGRFPIRVELSPLTRDDLLRILTEPHHSLTRQQQELLKVEGLEIIFEDKALAAMADLASQANATLENIGARRLMTIVERVFESLNFEAPQMVEAGSKTIAITAELVRQRVGNLAGDQDLGKFVL